MPCPGWKIELVQCGGEAMGVSNFCLPVIRKLISVFPLRGGLDVLQDLIECRAIKKLAV